MHRGGRGSQELTARRRVDHAQAAVADQRRVVTYSVITRGRVTASMEVFRRQAQETYDDPRGWRAGGVEFRRAATPAARAADARRR